MKRGINRGFTMIDFLVSVAVFLGVLGLISINLLSGQKRTQLTAATDLIVADLRLQQFKAMAGDTEGRSSSDRYGLYFGNSSYTAFHGSSYNASDTSNFVTTLPNGVAVNTIAFAGRVVIFEKGSGEVVGFDGNNNTLNIGASGQASGVTIRVNRYGVVDDVQ
jgi:type II secretory pathway pseudopilin PulG